MKKGRATQTFLCKLTGLVFAITISVGAIAQMGGPPPLHSPEVSAKGDVTFRLRAPNAKVVNLGNTGDIAQVPFGESVPFKKNQEGIWELTLKSVPGGAYRYYFDVDGVAVNDPSNTEVSERNSTTASLAYVPGAEFMDTQKVPHGAVAEVTYYSEELKRHRRMHVYTPPGYSESRQDYPVFYLLHGAMDGDDSWHTVGRAGFILDNLISAGKAKPMVVVMPNGHTRSFSMGRDSLPLEEFTKEFKDDIKPFIEENYRVKKQRKNTAIAGLSMGGAHTLEISMSDLKEYGYVGVYSSGVFSIQESDEWERNYKEALSGAAAKKGLELFWFACGKDDFLIETARASVKLFEKHNFDITYVETEGGHTWINWREYLNEFAPQLFQ